MKTWKELLDAIDRIGFSDVVPVPVERDSAFSEIRRANHDRIIAEIMDALKPQPEVL